MKVTGLTCKQMDQVIVTVNGEMYKTISENGTYIIEAGEGEFNIGVSGYVQPITITSVTDLFND